MEPVEALVLARLPTRVESERHRLPPRPVMATPRHYARWRAAPRSSGRCVTVATSGHAMTTLPAAKRSGQLKQLGRHSSAFSQAVTNHARKIRAAGSG